MRISSASIKLLPTDKETLLMNRSSKPRVIDTVKRLFFLDFIVRITLHFINRTWTCGQENLHISATIFAFFFDYQVGHMYNRYFMWNFAGRQNHLQGYGDGMRGNWVSGLSSLDHQRIPGLNAYEQSFDAYSGSQHYFFIPLVFGLLGGLFQWKRNPRDLFVVACLFFFTGLAIVLYLNQTPMQPRERDYAYAGSFYVFAIWIGLGALWVCRGLRRIAISRGRFLPEYVSLGLLTIPVLMLAQNWESHDRSDRKLPREMA